MSSKSIIAEATTNVGKTSLRNLGHTIARSEKEEILQLYIREDLLEDKTTVVALHEGDAKRCS